MAISYPRKQTIFIALLCILAVAGSALYINKKNNNLKQENKLAIINQNEVYSAPLIEISTSTDWRNQFFIKSTSTPTKKLESASNSNTPTGPETLTDRFSKDFFAQFMLLKQNNQIENPTAQNYVVDQAVDDFVNSASQAKIYDYRNIKLSLDSSIEAQRIYANSVGAILSEFAPRMDAAMVAVEALEENNPSLIKDIEDISEFYDVVLQKLLLVPTPEPLIDLHVNLINGASAMSFVSKGMSKVFVDPMQSLIALATYEESFRSFYEALLDLNFFFTLAGFQFLNSEPAIYFSQIN